MRTMNRWTRQLLVAAGFAVIAIAGAPTSADASKGCWCWIGFERGERLIDYGSVDRYRDLESGKKRKCAAACSARCARDINDTALLCEKIGRDYTYDERIGCFSVVGAKDSPNNTWDYDARPTPFPGCSKCCKCDSGWYDANHDSCVIGTGCGELEGLPNGDKGGGYFAWDGKLFKEVPGAQCRLEVGACEDEPKTRWTPWLDRDDAGGSGDYETLTDFVDAGQACSKPTAIECQTTDGRDWKAAGQDYTCQADQGGICVNRGQRCLDYRVRFLCPQ